MTIVKAMVITKNGGMISGFDQNRPESILRESPQLSFPGAACARFA